MSTEAAQQVNMRKTRHPVQQTTNNAPECQVFSPAKVQQVPGLQYTLSDVRASTPSTWGEYCSGSKLWVTLEPYKHNIKPGSPAAQWVASLPLGWTLFIGSQFESQLGLKPSSKCVDC